MAKREGFVELFLLICSAHDSYKHSAKTFALKYRLFVINDCGESIKKPEVHSAAQETMAESLLRTANISANLITKSIFLVHGS
jgi:hypothetical protein